MEMEMEIRSLARSFTHSSAAIAWLLFATVVAAQNQPRIALIMTNQNYALTEFELQNRMLTARQ
jgi:hypothetical protein